MKGTPFYTGVKYKIFYLPKDTRQNGTVDLYIVTSSCNLTCTLWYVAYYMLQDDTQNYQTFSTFLDEEF